MSKAITERHEERGPETPWGPGVETAPSVLREDEPTVARTVGLAGLCLTVFSAAFLVLNLTGVTARVGIGLSSLLLTIGVMATLAHAAYDREIQVRRLYWALGLALLAVGILLCLIPIDGQAGALFGAGYPAITLALLYLLATLHHETDVPIRRFTIRLLGLVGFIGFFQVLVLGNNLFAGKDYLLPYGLLVGLLSLAYCASFISQEGVRSDLGYNAARLLTVLGVLAVLIGLVRSVWPGGRAFFVPYGLTYLFLGMTTVFVSLGFWSENRLIVMTRREMATLFYSPIGYIVLFVLTLLGWLMFLPFLSEVIAANPEQPLIEPIVSRYILSWLPVFCVIFIVPVLTMRLLSEEWRSGTMEVMLTAPINETSIVLSKFFAALTLFVLLWVPWGLFLVGLRIGGGQPFDYFALLSFYVVLICTGASFIAMGLFFSSLTSNQIISAVLTFALMMAQLLLLFAERLVDQKSAWKAIIEHVSYVNTWINSFQGFLIPGQLLFHLSFAVFWLFLTVKVLDSRKWS